MDRIFPIYFVMIGLWLILTGSDTYRIERIFGKKAYRVQPVFAVLFALPLVYFAWTRDLGIGDTGTYMKTMNLIPTGFNELVQYLDRYPKDPGYTILVWMMKTAGISWRGMFLLIAIIQICPLIYVYRKYSSNYYFSMLLFLISTDYISWMQNGIRQFIAVSIIFGATGFILNKKYLQAILIILFASTFHQSALLMIPAIFLVQGEALNMRMMSVFILFFLAFVFVTSFTTLLDTVLQETQYSNMVSDFTEGEFINDDGTNPLRVLVYSMPVLLAILLKIRGCQSFPPIINLSVNMSMFCVGFYLVSMVTSGIFIGRIPIYFSLYNYILIPWEIEKLFKKSQIRLIVFTIIGLYIIFSMVQFSLI